MRTALFAPCYLTGNDASGTPRLARVTRYLNYYLALKEELGFDKIFLDDDGSDYTDRKVIENNFDQKDVEIFQNSKLMKRLAPNHPLDYPWCWRALSRSGTLMTEYRFGKVITIDTDGFILSPRLAHYIRDLQSGWEAFWVTRYDFPTAELHVLCLDAYPKFRQFDEKPWAARNGLLMEDTIPFTRVNKTFNVDRFGETDEEQRPGMDFYGQASHRVELIYNRYGKGRTL